MPKIELRDNGRKYNGAPEYDVIADGKRRGFVSKFKRNENLWVHSEREYQVFSTRKTAAQALLELQAQPRGVPTPRQQEVYDFIVETLRRRHYAPTVREIGERFKIRSPNGVMCHLKALEKKGLIRRPRYQRCAIEILDNGNCCLYCGQTLPTKGE